jgi:hypothetical protein
MSFFSMHWPLRVTGLVAVVSGAVAIVWYLRIRKRQLRYGLLEPPEVQPLQLGLHARDGHKRIAVEEPEDRCANQRRCYSWFGIAL